MSDDAPVPAPITHRTPVYKAIMWLLVAPVYALVFPSRVRGREHLPQGAAVIAANHLSFLDIPLVAKGAAPRHVSFVARDTLARTGWMAFVLRRTGAVLVRRGSADRAALREVVAHLEAGDYVGIFPEGTRSSDGRLGSFKKGALLAARVAGVPIVPCALQGSYRAWPRGRWPRPARLAITFGPPVPSELPDALQRVQGAVAAMLGEPGPGATP